MGKLMVPEANDHACLHGIMPHQEAETQIIRVHRLTPDHIARVYVLEADLHADLFEMILDAVTKQLPDIDSLDIARGLLFAGRRETFLASAFSNHDHGMAPAFEPLLQGGKETSVLRQKFTLLSTKKPRRQL